MRFASIASRSGRVVGAASRIGSTPRARSAACSALALLGRQVDRDHAVDARPRAAAAANAASPIARRLFA